MAREQRMAQVMVVDMLEGFTRIGPLASRRVDALVPRQAECLGSLPPAGLVVFLADAHEPDDFELKRFPPHCLRGTKEAEIRAELLDAARTAKAKIEIVPKRTFSGFFETDLDGLVRHAPSRQWVVFGCVTDCCIEANVAELVYRGCEITVVRSLIDTWDTSAEAARTAGLSEAYIHLADPINEEWFMRRLPAIWGVKVVEDWGELWK
jgi:nicotinamidase-related amidase